MTIVGGERNVTKRRGGGCSNGKRHLEFKSVKCTAWDTLFFFHCNKTDKEGGSEDWIQPIFSKTHPQQRHTGKRETEVGWGESWREAGELRAKGGVPWQPWHNTDGSLSGFDMTWLRTRPDPRFSFSLPPPLLKSHTNYLTRSQMCNGKRHPASETTHQNKHGSLISSPTHPLLIYILKQWSCPIPSLTTPKQWFCFHKGKKNFNSLHPVWHNWLSCLAKPLLNEQLNRTCIQEQFIDTNRNCSTQLLRLLRS